MGGELYQDWLEAGTLVLIEHIIPWKPHVTTPPFVQEGDDKFDAVWNLLQHEHLPRENYKNIQYLFKVQLISKLIIEIVTFSQKASHHPLFSAVPKPGDHIEWPEQNDCQQPRHCDNPQRGEILEYIWGILKSQLWPQHLWPTSFLSSSGSQKQFTIRWTLEQELDLLPWLKWSLPNISGSSRLVCDNITVTLIRS